MPSCGDPRDELRREPAPATAAQAAERGGNSEASKGELWPGSTGDGTPRSARAAVATAREGEGGAGRDWGICSSEGAGAVAAAVSSLAAIALYGAGELDGLRLGVPAIGTATVGTLRRSPERGEPLFASPSLPRLTCMAVRCAVADPLHGPTDSHGGKALSRRMAVAGGGAGRRKGASSDCSNDAPPRPGLLLLLALSPPLLVAAIPARRWCVPAKNAVGVETTCGRAGQ